MNAPVRAFVMSADSVGDYIFLKPTPKLHDLTVKARDETREEAIGAKETPVSKLMYTSGCRDVTAEYYREHHKVSGKLEILGTTTNERNRSPLFLLSLTIKTSRITISPKYLRI